MLKPKHTWENLGKVDPIKDDLNDYTKEKFKGRTSDTELPENISLEEQEANLLSSLAKEIEKMDKKQTEKIDILKQKNRSNNNKKPS